MNYFLDSNIIIDLLNNKNNATQSINPIITNDNSKLYINRLVYTECLRTIKYQNTKIFEVAKATLDAFVKLDITQSIYDEAIMLSRYCNSQGLRLKGKCAAIDFIHFATAKHYKLKMITNDGDFEKLEKIYYEKYEKYN